MKLRKNLTVLLTACLILSTGFVSCGKKEEQLSTETINSFEHTVYELPKQEIESDQPVIDAEGFYVTDDFVYVAVDTAVLKASASTEAENSYEASYASKLHRTGYNPDGWMRIEKDGSIAYVRGDYVTEMTLDFNAEFTYSLAGLDIVDTSRQFYSYDDMAEDLAEIRKRFPEAASLGVIGLCEDGRSIFEMKLGNPEAKHHILLVGGMEGCEYMTSLFLTKLCEYYAHYANEGIYNGFSYSELMDKCCLHVVPMLNPDGVIISQYSVSNVHRSDIQDKLKAWFERDQVGGGTSLSLDSYLMFFYANANGTEITKNFPANWDAVESAENPGSKGYKGASAGSENETSAVMKLIEKTAPELVINFRTTGNTVSFNYAGDEQVNAKAGKYASVLSEKLSFTKNEEEQTTAANGSLEKYCAEIKGIPAMRVCIGNGDAPLSLNEYNSIWNSGRESLAALMAAMTK